MVTLGNLTSQLLSGRISADDSITKAIYTQFQAVSISTKLSELSLLFDNDHFALVVTTQRCYVNKDTVSEKSLIFGVVTRIDLLNYIIANKPKFANDPANKNVTV
jgi:cystathionine beta-synthase